METHVVLLSIRHGIMNQLLQIFFVNDAIAGMTYLTEVLSTIEELENTIQRLNEEYPNLYINILNDKELENEISKKLNIPKWEDRLK